MEQERKAHEKIDKKYRTKGYTHRVDAWIHAEGDDRQITMYTKGEPLKADIQRELKKAKSVQLDDFSVTKL